MKNIFKRNLFKIVITISLIITPCVLINADDRYSEKIIQNVIEKYYDLSYDSYLDLKSINLSSVLDLNSIQNQNKITSLNETIEKWKYAVQKGYCDDIRERYPIIYNFIKIEIVDNMAMVFLNIDGDKNEAYPPFVTFGENKFVLKYNDSNWLISEQQNSDIEIIEQNDKLLPKKLNEKIHEDMDIDYQSVYLNSAEFVDGNIIDSDPYYDYNYVTSRAVNYANNFVSTGNSFFYIIDGNDCTNFISQCVSYGYGDTTSYSNIQSYRMMSSVWSAGSGGGYAAWENVSSHWNYMIQNKNGQPGPRVTISTWANTTDGGVMQIDFTGDGTYDHTVICVSKSLQKFAQHTSNTYRYWNDYSGVKRYYKPNYFREY